MEFGRKRYGAKKFFIYFQSFSNTHAPLNVLKEKYGIIRKFNDIAGLSVGTRPDCVDSEKLDLIAGFAEDYEVWIEYGLQSIHDRTLKAVNRNHTYNDFLKAVEETEKRPGIKICAHVIIGLPGETSEEIYETASELAGLKIEGVKIHPLHVVKDTKMEEDFSRGKVRLLSMCEYAELAAGFIQRLYPETVIQRVTADCPADYLIAPDWINEKNKVLNLIEEKLGDGFQGSLYKDE